MHRYVEETAPRRGVFAYLESPADTICVNADEYYPIEGNFINNPVGSFRLHGDRIEYIGDRRFDFSIVWFASLESSKPNNRIHIAVKYNSIVLDSSQMCNEIMRKPDSCAGTVVQMLRSGDTIQLVTKSEKARATLTFNHFTTSIKVFF